MIPDELLQSLAWPIAVIGTVLGLLLVLFAERYVRCLRRWMHIQQRMIRRPAYLRMHKVIGWALFVFGVALLALLFIQRG